ncbi:MAG: fibronectin type III domain-containing protein [Candidatus Thiodiazotropha sp. 6PLUC5]
MLPLLETANAAVNDFSGEFANANWTAAFQVFGCGSSSVVETATDITLATANNCASIGANYIHTNGGGGATRAGTASFNYNVTEVGDHTFSALYGISGGATTTVANNAPAAGAATQAVAVGEQLIFAIGKSASTGVSTLEISAFIFNFAPDIPTAASGTAADSAVTVSWTAPVDSGDAAITSYTVTALPGGATCTTATTSCTVPGLTNGTPYTFTVTATNIYGTGAPSVATAPVTPMAAVAVVATAIPTLSQFGLMLLLTLTLVFGSLLASRRVR